MPRLVTSGVRCAELAVAVLDRFNLLRARLGNLSAQPGHVGGVIGRTKQEIRERQIGFRTVVQCPQPLECGEISAGIDTVGRRLMTYPIGLHQIVDNSIEINACLQPEFRHVTVLVIDCSEAYNVV